MKRVSVMCLVAVLLIASVGSADDIRFHGSGSWDMLEGIGQTEGWQSTAVPGSDDIARANWGGNTVTLDYAAPDILGFQLGVDESGGFEINAGGVLTALGNSKIGNNGAVTGTMTINAGGIVNANGGWMMVAGNSSVTGVLDINGGEMNVAGHMWTATGAGSTAIIDIDGGSLSVGGMLGLGTVNAVDPSGGIATLSVNDGGTLALSGIHGGITDGTGSSIQPGSMININGSGMVTKTGHFVSVMEAYAAAGLISGDGIVGNVVATYDAAADLTTVVVPEPASMILLGLGGLVLRRRRK